MQFREGECGHTGSWCSHGRPEVGVEQWAGIGATSGSMFMLVIVAWYISLNGMWLEADTSATLSVPTSHAATRVCPVLVVVHRCEAMFA